MHKILSVNEPQGITQFSPANVFYMLMHLNSIRSKNTHWVTENLACKVKNNNHLGRNLEKKVIHNNTGFPIFISKQNMILAKISAYCFNCLKIPR